MKTIPEFTEAEIHEMMDFKQVLVLAEDAHRRSRKIARGVATTVLIIGLVGAAWFAYDRYSPSESSTPPETATNSTPPGTVEPPVVLPDTTRAMSPDHTEVAKKKPVQKVQPAENKTPIAGKNEETAPPILVDSVKSMSVFLPAEPVDGYTALYEYFARELRYPEQAIKDSIQGVVLVSFIISTTGIPQHVATDHLLGEDFETEAIRLIEHMPAWRPAQLDGTPVRSKLSVPITFKVQTNKTQRQP